MARTKIFLLSTLLFLIATSTTATASGFSCTSGVWKDIVTGVEVIDRGSTKSKKNRFKAKMGKCTGGKGAVLKKGYWPSKPTQAQMERKFGTKLTHHKSYDKGDGGKHSTTDMYTVK